MPLVPYNSVGGFSTGLTMTGVIDSLGNITGVGATFSGLIRANAGISAAGGVTFANAISVDLIKIGRGAGGVTSNVAIGNGYDGPNLQVNTTGEQNTAIGYDVLPYNTTGNYNVGVGTSALEDNNSGSSNTAVGNSALIIGNGSENTAVGAGALTYNNNNQNTAIGYQAGAIRGTGSSTRTSGTGGIFIGYQARASGNARTNEIVIGTNALGLGSNTAVIGATAQTAATIYGLMNLPGGLSAAGGVTLSGFLQGTTANFTGLISFTAGLSGTGITLSGNLSAATKSFVIPHPTKPQMTLQHGSLEGPENGVYVRGHLINVNTIPIPDYWYGLVDSSSITVNLTEIGMHNPHWVVAINDYNITVASENNNINCFYTVWGERKDVGKMTVEY